MASTILVVILLVTTISWIVKFLYGRRHLYAAARKAQGPPYIPFFGVSFDLFWRPWDFLDILNGYFERYPGLTILWFGTQQIWGITKPEYMKIVMNHPNSYGKMMYMYKSLVFFIGQGLITVQDAPLMTNVVFGKIIHVSHLAGCDHAIQSWPDAFNRHRKKERVFFVISCWKRHRKTINLAFNQRILEGFMEVFVDNCSILMDKLKIFDGKGEFNIHESIYKCNLDIVCESMMGVKVDAQTTDSTYHRAFERLLDIALLRMVHIGYHMDWYFNRTKLYTENFKSLRILDDITNKVIRTKTHEHENKSMQRSTQNQVQPEEEDYTKCKALADLLIEEESFTESEIRDEVTTFIMAGADTSTAAGGFTLIMLAMHPEVQDKVLEEILSVVGSDRNIEFKDLCRLKYLENCVKETLRLFPPVSFIFRQVDGDIKLDDEMTLPKNSGILFGIMALHRSATYWPDPLRFDPDRFLPDNVAKRHPYAYVPFSGGPRNCIGYKFALMSIKTIVGTVVRRYKVTTSYKNISDIELRANIVLKMKNGVKISLQHR